MSKKAYFENRLKNSMASKILRIINDITNRQNKDNCFPHKLDIKEKYFFKAINIVNKLNRHFSNVGKQTCTKSCSTLNLYCNLKKYQQ